MLWEYCKLLCCPHAKKVKKQQAEKSSLGAVEVLQNSAACLEEPPCQCSEGTVTWVCLQEPGEGRRAGTALLSLARAQGSQGLPESSGAFR